MEIENAESKFKFYEIVRIIAVSERISENVLYKEGIVVGMSDSGLEGPRQYGVHINEYGTTFSFPENALEGTGKTASPRDAISRSRWKGK
jgi:hypothetical protein